jgi:hypothetical protein
MSTAEFSLPIPLEQAEVFTHWLPNTQITTISPENIPEAALGVFEDKSSCFIDPETYRPLNFNFLYLIKHGGGDRTFVATQTKDLNDGPEQSAYVVDVDDDGQIMGYSELRYVYDNPKDFFKGKPFEQWSGTEQEFTHRGLSTRRIFVMNALSQMLYRLPLYSSTHFVHHTNDQDERIQPQKIVWEKLVIKGFARKFKQGGYDRFVFTGQQ